MSSEPVIAPAGATFEVVWADPATMRMRGELDLAAVLAVKPRLICAVGDLDLDCSELTFIDAAGLRLLVTVHRGCEQRGAKLTIVNPAPCVMRLLALTGLDDVLRVRGVSSTR